MHTRAWIGNDVVDLTEPGVAGKEHDRRFMDRVFTPEEQARIRAAAEPTLALWKTWAAKETAFKIASKFREGVIFAHREFHVGAALSAPGVPTTPAAPSLVAARSLSDWVRVQFDDLQVRVHWETARDHIHCVGQLVARGEAGAPPDTWDRWPRLLTRVLHDDHTIGGVLSRAERASAYSIASERARLLARHLMERWDLHRAEIMRFRSAHGWGPPVIACEGEPVRGYDISLSHDGRFVAAVLSGPA